MRITSLQFKLADIMRGLRRYKQGARMQLAPFKNEPLSNFKGNSEHFRQMQQALEDVKKELGAKYPAVIGSERVEAAEVFHSYNPAVQDQVVGTFPKGTSRLGALAIEQAEKRFQTGGRTPAGTRVRLLAALAGDRGDRKFHFAAWVAYQVRKPWAEAEADLPGDSDVCDVGAGEKRRLDEAEGVRPEPEER